MLELQSSYGLPAALKPNSDCEQFSNRMRYVALTDGIRGLTVSCDRASNVSIHSHPTDPAQAKDFYERIEAGCGSSLVWIYFPLAIGERVSRAWIREVDNSLNICDPVVAVRDFSLLLCSD